MIQVSFVPRNCSSQFHWGKNFWLERKQLRDMFSQASVQTNVTPNSMVVSVVSPYPIKGQTGVLYFTKDEDLMNNIDLFFI